MYANRQHRDTYARVNLEEQRIFCNALLLNLLVVSPIILAGCAMQIHAPTVSHHSPMEDDPWLTRCETARVVIFGDSLTDTGRLKQRLKIFPIDPYWLGRFSNGPAWPEYLAMVTGMGVQNHAYRGASAAERDALPGENFYGRIRHVGQFFVSGTIDLQIGRLSEQIQLLS